jgi:O-antigen/teichoic acid export membrane protein
VSRSILRVLEVLLLRAGPGLLNALTLIQLAGWLSPAAFGAYSTAVAAAGLGASVGFGPLTFSIVSQYAGVSRAERGPEYVAAVAALVLGAAGGLFVLAAALWATHLPGVVWLLGVAAFGAHSVLQELLRAKLRLWSYGLSATIQATSFYSAAWILAGPAGATVAKGLAAYALSFGLAAAASFALLGFPAPWRARFGLLRVSLRVGRDYTLSTIAENGVALGQRYILMWFAPPAVLATYAFAMDLAQRLAGFLVSAVSFAFVPQAFREAALDRPGAFRATLLRGAAIGAGMAAISVVGVLALRELSPWPDLRATPFDSIAFVLVSLALVANRIKKLVVDPFALRGGRTWTITAGHVAGAVIAFPVLAVALSIRAPYAAEIALLLACVAAGAVSLRLLRREVLGPS